jgi:hypothetical protein
MQYRDTSFSYVMCSDPLDFGGSLEASTHFADFWTAIVAAAEDVAVAWSAGEKWIKAESCLIPAREMSINEERSLTHIGVNLAHSTLRPFQNALQVLGARRLTLMAVIDALEIWDRLDDEASKGKDAIESFLRPLWTATDALVPTALASLDGGRAVMARLKAIRFAPASNDNLVSLDDLYRLPSPITNSQLEKHIPDLPVVSGHFSIIENLYKCIDVLSFERLLDEIGGRINDETEAKRFFGTDTKRIRMFYRFLSDYLGRSSSFPDENAMPPLNPDVADLVPSDPALTAYDEQHAVTYLRILDADAEGADWREVARIVVYVDLDREPNRTREAFENHLVRAKWTTKEGYRRLLQRGWRTSGI